MTYPIRPTRAQASAPSLAGAWEAYVLASDATGFTCSVPKLLGNGTVTGCEAIPGPTYAVGDAVWVMAINGNRGRFLIIGPRQRDPL